MKQSFGRRMKQNVLHKQSTLRGRARFNSEISHNKKTKILLVRMKRPHKYSVYQSKCIIDKEEVSQVRESHRSTSIMIGSGDALCMEANAIKKRQAKAYNKMF